MSGSYELSTRGEDAFLGQLVELFGPKVVDAASKGFTWWEVAGDVREILDGKAETRIAGLPKERRTSARRGYDRFHRRVLAKLRESYPKTPVENN